MVEQPNADGVTGILVDWVGQTRAFASRQFRETMRSKVALFWSFAFPVIWYFLTVHLNAIPGARAIDGPNMKAILGISFGIFGAFTVTLVGFTGSLTADIEAKRYRKYRTLPLPPSADLAGRFTSGASLGIIAWVITVTAAVLDGASYQLNGLRSVPLIALAVVSFCLIGMTAGLLVALVVPRADHATTAATGIVVVWFFVTGYNGTVPHVFPASGELLNVVPNALATRFVINQLVDVNWVNTTLVPPSMPGDLGSITLLVGYAIGLTGISVGVIHWRVYGTDLGE